MKQYIAMLLHDPKLYQYMMVGGIAAMVDISLFLIFGQYLNFHYLILATASFIIATLVNYLLCSLFVFKYPQAHPVKMRVLLTYMVSGVGLCIHHGCLLLGVEWLGFSMLLSKLLAMGTAFGWNYLSRKHFVFIPAPRPMP